MTAPCCEQFFLKRDDERVYLKKLVFGHVTLVKVIGQVSPCGKNFPCLRYMWAKDEKKRLYNEGAIQGST